MRKAMILILVLVTAMFSCAFAESTSTSINGSKAIRTNSELYLILRDNDEDVLVRISSSGETVCVDRADDIDGMVPYAGGFVYLKTDDSVSSISLCSGLNSSVMYKFDGMVCEDLSVYNDYLLVTGNGLLYSVDPNEQVCLKLSGAQILQYCLGGDYAYFLSGTDMMQYSADVSENGETTTVSCDVGCIYRLDLTTGETTLMLKSGGTDLKIKDSNLYFHSMQEIYAVLGDAGYELRGHLYSLNVEEKNLNAVCSEDDKEYWPLDDGVAVWCGNTVTLLGNDSRTLYEAGDDAQIVSDGTALYAWEPTSQTLTRIASSGLTETVYSGVLGDMQSVAEAEAAAVTAAPTVEPTAEPAAEQVVEETTVPEATAIPDGTGSVVEFTDTEAASTVEDGTSSVLADDDNTAWFDDFMEESQNVSNATAAPTPIGATPTPSPLEDEETETVVKVSVTPIPDSYVETTPVSQNGIRIIDSAANLRIGPGTDYEKIGSVPQGKVAASLGLAAKASNGTTWYKVYYNGLTGWVSSKYSEPTNSAASSTPATQNVTAASENGETSGETSSEPTAYTTYSMSGTYVHVTGGAVNVRSGPATDYSVKTSIPNGKYATFEGQYAINANGGKWYKVSYDGTTGWVSSSLTSVTDSKSSSSSSSSSGKVKTTGDVTIRKSANKTSAKLGYIPSGTTVTYLGSSSVDSRGVRWYKIKYNGIKGWISSKYSKLK